MIEHTILCSHSHTQAYYFLLPTRQDVIEMLFNSLLLREGR
ncbi:hypothetical protein [Bombiscardovia coagulans]|uniref:Uncharacterized protein n=1 Tax=Bombiscardovia coagulans TaxID=686666 RepID=A0A261EQQ8_9BIFI|nr:hypothetical protein [Bombiscardovia coagulans]OZG49191.1 hypothetical protein BOCO_1000 [Bombiscardovia coagulans]